MTGDTKASVRPKKPPVPLEKEIQKAIQSRFKAMGIQCNRRNAALTIIKGEDKNRAIKSGERGQADLYGWLPISCKRPSVHWEGEVKRPGEVPTLIQAEWLRKANAGTQAAWWADDPDIAEGIMEALMAGGRIAYHPGNRRYGKEIGPNFDFDVVF